MRWQVLTSRDILRGSLSALILYKKEEENSSLDSEDVPHKYNVFSKKICDIPLKSNKFFDTGRSLPCSVSISNVWRKR